MLELRSANTEKFDSKAQKCYEKQKTIYKLVSLKIRKRAFMNVKASYRI